ncbi:hypothetical protein ACH4C6_21660 [Streptomyces sp. NPDC017943]|uniref:hypothetical protein n=1 Tax=Streptomyces sp. NPDC017943 TaxID=3365019 RepID=UPI0037AC19CA
MHKIPFRHPLATHAAGTILGYVGGRPVYAIAGGSDEGAGAAGSGGQPGSSEPGQSGQGAAGTGAQGSSQGGQQSGQPGSSDPWAEFQWDGKVESLPEPVAKVIREAREEAGKSRTTAKANAAQEARQELAQEIGKALGLVKDDKPADPAELTRTITTQTTRIGELESTNRTLAVELAAYKAADKHGANPAALLDSRSFLESVKGLDPSASDFTTKLDDAIKAAVDSNAQLRTGLVPRRGGGDFTGGPGTQRRPTSLHDAIAAKLGG